MKLCKNKNILITLLLVQTVAQAIEGWERPSIPKDEAGRYKLETERANLHDKIIEAEKAKEEGKEIDETDLKLKKGQQKYIDTTLSTFDTWSAAKTDAGKETALRDGKEKLGKINIEIMQAEQSQSGFNQADNGTTNKPNFIETAYLNVKRFFKERQLKSALGKNSDIVHINRLQKSLEAIYTKLNDAKAKQKLENIPLNFRPEAIKEHLERFKKSINDHSNENITQEIQQYLEKYVKKIIDSGIEFELENLRNKEKIIEYQKTINDLLESMGIDQTTREQALQSITNTLKQVTPENIKKTITDFFENKGTNTHDTYNQLKNEVLQDFKINKNPTTNTKLKNLEKALADLYQMSSLGDSLPADDKKKLNTFLANEYNELANAYNKYSQDFAAANSIESNINASTKANISQQRATRAVNDLEATLRNESQKLEQRPESNPALKNEIEKNKEAKPLAASAKKLPEQFKNDIQRFETVLSTNLGSAENYFNDTIVPTLNEYSKATKEADPAREKIDSDQKVIDSIETLLHRLYDYAQETPVIESEKNILTQMITQLIDKTYILNKEKAEEFKALLRELPNGTLIELPQSMKNPTINQPKEPINKAVLNAIEQQLSTYQPQDNKSLYNAIVKELNSRFNKNKDNGGGFG